MKIIKLDFYDIITAPEDCSKLIDKACKRQQPYKVVGCVSNNTTVFVTLEPGKTTCNYRFAPFNSLSGQDIVSEINSRYAAGFTTIGSFMFEENLWGLFAK